MARYRHPLTVGLAFEQWPALDKEAWSVANQTGDLLTGSGPAAAWKPKTHRTVKKAYGNWLRYLERTGQLKDVAGVGGRLTTENLEGYIAALRARVSARTAVTQLRSLSQAVLALDPDADRELLKLAISRVERIAPTSRSKSESLKAPTELVALGEHLMSTWQQRSAHDPRLNAMDYRDGLMIAFLARCPIRLENLAQMRVGQHLTREAGRWRVMFVPEEMKGKRALAFDFPEELSQALDTYLRTIHPMLCDGPEAGAPLWPSRHKKKRQMTAHGIYTRITQITSAHFGRPVTPHTFRDAAATFIAEMTPERARMAAAVLQHCSFETTLRHYIHGQQHLAAKRYHQAIAELVARVDNHPSR